MFTPARPRLHSQNLDPRDELEHRQGRYEHRWWVLVDASRETVRKTGGIVVETCWLSVCDAPGKPFRRDEDGHYVAVLPVEKLSSVTLGRLLAKVAAAFCGEGEGECCCDDPSTEER